MLTRGKKTLFDRKSVEKFLTEQKIEYWIKPKGEKFPPRFNPIT